MKRRLALSRPRVPRPNSAIRRSRRHKVGIGVEPQFRDCIIMLARSPQSECREIPEHKLAVDAGGGSKSHGIGKPNGFNRFGVSFKGRQQSAAGQVGKNGSTVCASREQEGAVMVDGEAGDGFLVPPSVFWRVTANRLRGFGVPHDYHAVLRSRNNGFAVGCELATSDWCSVSRKEVHDRARGNCPHPDREIAGACQQDIPSRVPVNPLEIVGGKN